MPNLQSAFEVSYAEFTVTCFVPRLHSSISFLQFEIFAMFAHNMLDDMPKKNCYPYNEVHEKLHIMAARKHGLIALFDESFILSYGEMEAISKIHGCKEFWSNYYR